VIRVKGAKVDIRTESGLLKDVHHDWVIVIPDDAEDFEARPDLKLADDAEGARRSPGQMLEGVGVADAAPPARGRLKGLQKGAIIAYKGEGIRRVRLGAVISLSNVQQSLEAHRYGAAAEAGGLRVHWVPLFFDANAQVCRGAGGRPVQETVALASVIMVVELHTGVLGHAAARRLDRSG